MADQKITKHIVTNVTDGPKVLNSVTPTLLHAGEEAGPFEISDAELNAAKATGWFKIEAPARGPAKDADKA